MAKQILTSLDFNNVAKITNLPSPSATGDAATKGYVDSAIEGLAWKDSCRVATQANITLSAPGATIDGITMVNGDRVLVKSQTTASENGIYVWSGSATPLTRSFDGQTSNDLEQAVVTVEEGTSAGATYRQTLVNFTLGTGSVNWTNFGTAAGAASTSTAGIIQLATQAEVDAGTDAAKAVTSNTLANYAGRAKKLSQAIGDGSATSYTVTHNFGTRDVHVTVYRNSGSFDTVDVQVNRTSTNAVAIVFDAAPTANQYQVVIIA